MAVVEALGETVRSMVRRGRESPVVVIAGGNTQPKQASCLTGQFSPFKSDVVCIGDTLKHTNLLV